MPSELKQKPEAKKLASIAPEITPAQFHSILTPTQKTRIKERIDETAIQFSTSVKTLKYVPGIDLIPESQIKQAAKELNEKLKNAKTEQDMKNFWKEYSLFARMAQSYIESAKSYQDLKSSGLEAVAWWYGIDPDKAKKFKKNIVPAIFIAAGIGSVKHLRELKQLEKLEKTAPNIYRLVLKAKSSLIEAEEAVKEAIKRESAFLKKLGDAAKASKLKDLGGFKPLEEIKGVFSNPKLLKELVEIKNDKLRGQMILKHILDPASAKMLSKNQKVIYDFYTSFLKGEAKLSSMNLDEFCMNYVKNGGTVDEAMQVVNALSSRMQIAGHTIGALYVKTGSETWHIVLHGFKNQLTTSSTFSELLRDSISEAAVKLGKVPK